MVRSLIRNTVRVRNINSGQPIAESVPFFKNPRLKVFPELLQNASKRKIIPPVYYRIDPLAYLSAFEPAYDFLFCRIPKPGEEITPSADFVYLVEQLLYKRIVPPGLYLFPPAFHLLPIWFEIIPYLACGLSNQHHAEQEKYEKRRDNTCYQTNKTSNKHTGKCECRS